ncbi:hypothetical protein HDU97_010002 [Phlyctochytrium planicorne]|nr:hypothetical protein HDU97_010002 [Phlyctochytrium planicorne]
MIHGTEKDLPFLNVYEDNYGLLTSLWTAVFVLTIIAGIKPQTHVAQLLSKTMGTIQESYGPIEAAGDVQPLLGGGRRRDAAGSGTWTDRFKRARDTALRSLLLLTTISVFLSIPLGYPCSVDKISSVPAGTASGGDFGGFALMPRENVNTDPPALSFATAAVTSAFHGQRQEHPTMRHHNQTADIYAHRIFKETSTTSTTSTSSRSTTTKTSTPTRTPPPPIPPPPKEPPIKECTLCLSNSVTLPAVILAWILLAMSVLWTILDAVAPVVGGMGALVGSIMGLASWIEEVDRDILEDVLK